MGRDRARSYVSPSLSVITLFAFSLSRDSFQKMLILRCSSKASWSFFVALWKHKWRRQPYAVFILVVLRFPLKDTNCNHSSLVGVFEISDWKSVTYKNNSSLCLFHPQQYTLSIKRYCSSCLRAATVNILSAFRAFLLLPFVLGKSGWSKVTLFRELAAHKKSGGRWYPRSCLARLSRECLAVMLRVGLLGAHL